MTNQALQTAREALRPLRSVIARIIWPSAFALETNWHKRVYYDQPLNVTQADAYAKATAILAEIDAALAAEGADPFSRRAYASTEPHLSGHRLVMGFENSEDCHEALLKVVGSPRTPLDEHRGGPDGRGDSGGNIRSGVDPSGQDRLAQPSPEGEEREEPEVVKQARQTVEGFEAAGNRTTPGYVHACEIIAAYEAGLSSRRADPSLDKLRRAAAKHTSDALASMGQRATVYKAEEPTTPSQSEVAGLVAELRARANARHSGEMSETAKLCARAADTIVELRAGVEQMATQLVRMTEIAEPVLSDALTRTTPSVEPYIEGWQRDMSDAGWRTDPTTGRVIKPSVEPVLGADALTVVRAILDAEVAFPDEPSENRSVGYYFRVGLDHYRRFDDMYNRLVAAAEIAAAALLSRIQAGGGR